MFYFSYAGGYNMGVKSERDIDCLRRDIQPAHHFSPLSYSNSPRRKSRGITIFSCFGAPFVRLISAAPRDTPAACRRAYGVGREETERTLRAGKQAIATNAQALHRNTERPLRTGIPSPYGGAHGARPRKKDGFGKRRGHKFGHKKRAPPRLLPRRRADLFSAGNVSALP